MAKRIAGKQSSAVSPARREAFAILLELERSSQAHADDLLRGPRVSTLGAQDRHLATALAMGVPRWQIRLDGLIRPLLVRPNARLDAEIQVALRMGAFQLLFLDRIPAHAAIGESVALAKRAGHTFAAGMVNAVLRKLAELPRPELGSASTRTVEELAEATAHPAWMVGRWVSFYGMEAAWRICRHGQEQTGLAIRVEDAAVEAELAGEGIELAPGGLLTTARRVTAGDVTATAAFASGRVRVQDEGSQLIAELAGRGSNILDCCAAPGGKTLILAERNPQARATALEVSPARCEALRLRMAATRFSAQVEVLQGDAAELASEPGYDLVLADVPCSGTGTLGRNPEIRHRLQLADLARHHERQCGILRGALRAGTGRVVYSTCSLEPEENAAVVAEVLMESPGWRQISLAGRIRELQADGRLTEAGAESLLGGVAADGALTLLPDGLGEGMQTDGFFVAMVERG